MRLQEMASLLLASRIIGDGDVELRGVQTDSRKVADGDLFICLRGYSVDGHHYVAQAEANGAAAIVAERALESRLPQLIVNDSRFAMAVIANRFYEYPSHEMKVIGITGTNGKTTTTFILNHILRDREYRTGLIGTIGVMIGDTMLETNNTTPEALELQAVFRDLRNVDTQYCVMEVSSHALTLGRVKGCRFRTAVFTNLTQDHLDYHKSIDNYREAKGLLFSRLGNTYSHRPEEHKFAVLNADDPASEYFRSVTAAQVITYGIHNDADVQASQIRITPEGTSFQLVSFAGNAEVKTQMIGFFNVYNTLAAITAALAEGFELGGICSSIERFKGVDGRFQAVREGQNYHVIVDYAHTPDGLENVLTTIRGFAKGKIYCVFGCGGDRDRTKRPVMGQIAARYSDYVFVTSDNPRTENPEAIIRDVTAGITEAGYRDDRFEQISDRRVAIEKAIAKASLEDVVLIAGKGHETYQEINGVRHDFDDRLIAKQAIRSRYDD